MPNQLSSPRYVVSSYILVLPMLMGSVMQLMIIVRGNSNYISEVLAMSTLLQRRSTTLLGYLPLAQWNTLVGWHIWKPSEPHSDSKVGHHVYPAQLISSP